MSETSEIICSKQHFMCQFYNTLTSLDTTFETRVIPGVEAYFCQIFKYIFLSIRF